MATFSMVFTDSVSNPTMGAPNAQIGDGRPYTAAEWRLYWKYLFCRGGVDRGVFKGVLNECAVTVIGVRDLQVDTGLIMCNGGIVVMETHEHVTPVNAGAGTTRKDSVICELDLDNSGVGQYKVRVTYKQGTAGAYPAMTQNIATVWQIRLYNYIIDDAGAITSLSDQRSYLRIASEFDHGELLGLADDDHPQYYNAARLTKAVIDALGINAATVGGFTAAQLMNGIAVGFSGATVLFGGALGGSDGHRPIDPITAGAHEDWHWANGELVAGVQTLDSRGKFVLGSDGAAGTYPVNATGGAATINIEHNHAGSTLDTANESTHIHAISITTAGGGGHSHALYGNGGLAVAAGSHTHQVSGATGAVNAMPDASHEGASAPFTPGPNHTHVIPALTTNLLGLHTHIFQGDTAVVATHAHALNGNSQAGAAHKHTITGSIANAGSTTQAILPPYRAWYLITFVG